MTYSQSTSSSHTETLAHAAEKYAQVHSPTPPSAEHLRRVIAAAFEAGYNYACDRMAEREREALSDEQQVQT